MNERPYYAVILAGGKGERFWPLSTAKRPKQLLDLVGNKAMIAQAVDRISDLIPADHVFVVTNAELVDATRAVLPGVPEGNIIGEPMGRDTAAAVALGCALVEHRDPAAAFCILTADHVMGDLPVFRRTLEDALALAIREPVLITMGIRPEHPDTGFGYIHAGAVQSSEGETSFARVVKFEEKPSLARAKTFVADGNYFWNSGMFIWSVPTLKSGLERFCAPLVCMMDAVRPHIGRDSFTGVLRKRFQELSKISIDYALMEKADNILMAEGGFAWDDVGSWPALEKHFEADEEGNTCIGNTELLDASGNILVSRERLTACIGVQNLIVVQAEGVTLVCPKDRAQDVKQLVKALHERGDCEAWL